MDTDLGASGGAGGAGGISTGMEHLGRRSWQVPYGGAVVVGRVKLISKKMFAKNQSV